MEYAGVGRRFVAVLVDLVLFLLVVALLGGAYSTTENGIHSVGIEGGWWPLLIFLGYYVAFEAILGSTIGKVVVGIRVVGEDAGSISWGQALARNLLRVVDALFCYFVAAIFVWSSPKRQRLGDRAANTFVIRDVAGHRGRGRVTPLAFEEPQPAAAADDGTYYTQEQFMEDLGRVKRVKD